MSQFHAVQIPRWRYGALISAFAVLLAGCGGGVAMQDGSGKAAAVPGVIKIGAPHPLSGAWAEFGQNSVNGATLCANRINEAGGIRALDGARLKVVPADTGTDPAQAQAVTTRLIQDDHVTALVGAYLSALSLTASRGAESAKIPMITESFVDKITERGYQYIFQIAPKSSEFGQIAVKSYLEIAKSQGRSVKRAAIISSDDAAGAAQAASVAAASAAAGIETGKAIVYPSGIADASAIGRPAAALNPDVVFIYGPTQDVVLIVRDLRSRGVDAPIMGTGGAGLLAKGLPDMLGPLAEGMLSLSAWSDDMHIPGVVEVGKAYRKAYSVSFMPQEAGEACVAVYQLAAAIQEAGTADPTSVRDALVDKAFTEGLAAAMPAGRVKFNKAGMNEDALPVVIQWQDGAPTSVWPLDIAAAPVR